MRILNVAAGVLLIAAGIYCLCNQDVALLSAGLLLGIFLLLSGVAEIVVFAAASGVMLGSGWLLLDGILTVIMSLFLLFNQWFTMLSLPFLFTLWLLFSGVSQCVSSFDLRALGVRAWGWILAVGILLTLAGFICLMDPWVSVAAMAVCVALVYLIVVRLSRRAMEPVVQSVQRQKQFITDAGHDLKTPITVIGSSLKVLEMEVGKQKWID